MRPGVAVATLIGSVVLGLGAGAGVGWLRPAGSGESTPQPPVATSPGPVSPTASTPTADPIAQMVTGQALVEAGWQDPIRITPGDARYGACLEQSVAASLAGQARVTAAVLSGGNDASGNQVVLEADSIEKAQELGTILYNSGTRCRANSAGRYSLVDQGRTDIDSGTATWFTLSGPAKSRALHAVVRVEKRVTLLWLEPAPSTSDKKLAQLEKQVASRLR